MPSNTTYYNLFIFDPSGDTGSTFLSFRTDIAGPSGSSNFIIIDSALHTHDTQITALQNVHGIIDVPLLYQSANFFTASGITAITSYADGLIIDASLDQDCTGAVTININSIGTKSLQKYNSTGSALINLSAGDMKKNKEYLFRYSFSAGVFIWINPTAGDQTNIVGTSGNFIKINTNNTLVDSGISQSNFSATGTFALSGDNLASPNTTTGAQNDVAITGLSVFGWNGGSASTINGFAGGAEGRILIIENQTTAYQLTISNENTGSSAVNRIRTPDQGSYIIGPRQSIQLIYDSIDNRWIIQEVGTYRSNPTMNGTASPGTAGQLQSSGDHVHPSDTTRAIGPGSSTANNLVKFSSTDGETLADAGTPLSVLNGAVTPGTSGNVLTSNGSVWTSAAPSGDGKIVPSVTSNNLTVAIKTLAGTDPSPTNPVTIRIGDTEHQITAALSVTIIAGANTFNSGSAELATHELNLFVYLGWNATDGVTLGLSRIPYACQYSDFSVTATNEKYCAISTITHAAAGDYYEVIGRFAATLSAGAGYTWTVPTFTAINLINRPIYETQRLSYLPAFAGWTSTPTQTFDYIVQGSKLILYGYQTPTTPATSNNTVTTFTLPFTIPALTNWSMWVPILRVNNSGYSANPGTAVFSNSTNAVACYIDWQGGAWTASGTKMIGGFAVLIPLV